MGAGVLDSLDSGSLGLIALLLIVFKASPAVLLDSWEVRICKL
jgi:hypothetical protein